MVRVRVSKFIDICSWPITALAGSMAHITRAFGPLAEAVWKPDGPYRLHQAVAQVPDPRFSLRLHAGGLGVYEQRTRTLFTIERAYPRAAGELRDAVDHAGSADSSSGDERRHAGR